MTLTRLPGSKWWVETDDVTTALVEQMYQAYQGDPRQVEIAQLIEKRDALIALRERLV